jgi:hypothetical protein
VKYMMLLNSPPTDGTIEGIAAAADNGCTVEDWIAFDRQIQDAGVVLDSHSLADLTTATTVRVSATGERTVTDGPFADAREILGGYYVLDVADLDAALDWAARCPAAFGGGSVVVRPVGEM